MTTLAERLQESVAHSVSVARDPNRHRSEVTQARKVFTTVIASGYGTASLRCRPDSPPRADRFGSVLIAHQPVIGSQAEVDSVHTSTDGAIRVQRCAIATQTIGHETSTIKSLKTGLFHSPSVLRLLASLTTGGRFNRRA